MTFTKRVLCAEGSLIVTCGWKPCLAGYLYAPNMHCSLTVSTKLTKDTDVMLFVHLFPCFTVVCVCLCVYVCVCLCVCVCGGGGGQGEYRVWYVCEYQTLQPMVKMKQTERQG